MNNRQNIALRGHDISLGLGKIEVPDFETLPRIGHMIRLSLQIRGLSIIEYETLRLVAYYYLNIPTTIFKGILKDLAEVGFVKLITEGKTIKKIIPTVPFYDDLYEKTGEFGETQGLNESEEVAILLLSKLTESPVNSSLVYQMGADKKLVDRNLSIGAQGEYIITKRARGKDILLSPLFFSENSELFSDMVAKSGAKTVSRILNLIKSMQGVPLAIVEKTKEINGTKLTSTEINLLKSLAYDSAIKPPSIITAHAGTNYFLFTPKPSKAKLSPTNREIVEKAMALVSSMRQGQYLPNKYRIRSPYAILNTLLDKGKIGANSEALEQYKKLTFLKVGRLEKVIGDMYSFVLVQSRENLAAVHLAIDLIQQGEGGSGLELDEDIRRAISGGQEYVESLISAKRLKETKYMPLSEENKEEVENLFLYGSGLK
jgi:hypothetical protein